MQKQWNILDVKKVIFHHERRQLNYFVKLLDKVNSPNPVMVELGAAEGLYSIMFHGYFIKKNIPHKNICLEMSLNKIKSIENNIPSAQVIHGYIGKLNEKDSDVLNLKNEEIYPKQITLEDIYNTFSLDFIDMLHVDIQGGEEALIEEMNSKKMFDKVKYLFLSTHDDIIPSIHKKCLNILVKSNKKIVINVRDTQSGFGYGDGLIIMENK